MTTTYKNATTQQMMNAIKGSNGSLVSISSAIIEQAKNNGLIIEIGRRENIKGNKNVYYAITTSENDVLMHVQDNMYVLVSRYLYCNLLNKEINVIPLLLKMSFYSGRTGHNRYHVMAGNGKSIDDKYTDTVYLTRVLTSLELYGEIRKLDSSWDVHHKGDCFDNRQNMLMYIPRAQHKHRTSHMTGMDIRSYQDLVSLFQYMKKSYQKLHLVTTVA